MDELTFAYSPWWLVAGIAVAIGLAWFAYWRTTPRLGGLKRGSLVFLRTLVLSIILFLLLQPLLSRVTTFFRQPVLAVLIDESESLGVTADVDSSTAHNKNVVRDLLRQLSLDAVAGDVRLYPFSSTVRPTPYDAGWPDSIQFNGQRTNIAGALEYVLDDLRTEHLGAVVLVSDGRPNAGRNPLFVAETYPVPIYAAVVGDTTARKDVLIRSVVTNQLAYVGTELPVRVSIRADQFGDEVVSVALLVDGAVLASERVSLPADGAEIPVDLTFTPDNPGELRLSVAVTRLPGEVTYRNNRAVAIIRVLESKRRVLLLASSPSPDVTALRKVLETDPNVEVTAVVQKSRGTYYDPPPTDLEAFDAMVLAGYPGRAADQEMVNRVLATISNGMPVLFVLGRDTDLARLEREFRAALPAVPGTIRRDFAEAHPTITPVGARHILLSDGDLAGVRWDRLPPIMISNSRWQLGAGTRVLATATVRGVALADPVVVVQRKPGQRLVSILGSGLWRWQNVSADLRDIAFAWETLVNNLMQWITTVEDDRPVRVRPIEPTFAGGEQVEFGGEVYDESLQPVSDARIDVNVTGSAGEEYPFVMSPLGNGRYALSAGNLPSGDYRFEATARQSGEVLGTDNGRFAVGELAIEFRETRADPVLMRQIAVRSSGAALAGADLATLATRLSEEPSFTALEEPRHDEIELWRRYVFLALVIVLLTVEWFVRKRSGLV